jgi:hypothetical protein
MHDINIKIMKTGFTKEAKGPLIIALPTIEIRALDVPSADFLAWTDATV